MSAQELFRAGKLSDAVKALTAEVRDNPLDLKRRTFLFELLCFAGDYDRAEKQLSVLGQEGPKSEMGALLYRGALMAERTRQEKFGRREYVYDAESEPPALPGALNGEAFGAVSDADPRIGPRLEVIAAGAYLWIPFAHIASIRIEPPRRLRDLLWIPAQIRTGPAFKGTELGEVLLPALAPLTWRHADDGVRLGRATVWEENEEGQVYPAGQKLLLVDGEEIPLLEVRSLDIQTAEAAAQS